MSDDAYPRRPLLAAMALFALIGALILADVLIDYRTGGSALHLAVETAVLLIAFTGAGVLWRQLHRSRTDLARARGEADRWRHEHQQLLAGLSAAIDQQFRRWQLSGAESEVGLLLLKGLSHKEIAEIRGTSERTIREQARALYRKADLSGRASLAAFFLEDLLLPPADDRVGDPAAGAPRL